MFSWVKLSHIQQWCQGELPFPPDEDPPIGQISTDTRTLKKGDVFLALRGENFDGHEYLEEAEKRGAVALISEKPWESKIPLLKVKDSLTAMVGIAKKMGECFSGKVIAITGSAGKSSTKDMVSILLGGRTLCSPASFNNLIGVSKTHFLLQDDTRNLVLEMGMNARGEIQALCQNFRPQAGVITNIGDAHMGRLGGPEGIYLAKKELFDHLATEEEPLGVALNLDDEKVVQAFKSVFSESVPVVTYSLGSHPADVRVLNRRMDPTSGNLSFDLEISNQRVSQRLPIFGLHHAQNIAAGVAAARLMGVSVQNILLRLSDIKPALHRGEIHHFAGDRIVVDESYNSNPTALKSSLESVFQIAPQNRHLLVLGDMLELGDFSENMHRKTGESIVALQAAGGCDLIVIGVGEGMTHLLTAVSGSLSQATCLPAGNAEEALATVKDHIQDNDIVLVKGSRGIGLDRVVEGLA